MITFQSVFRKIFHYRAVGKSTLPVDGRAKIIPRQAHTISRQYISRNALKVLTRLLNAGYNAYLVGGGVRDLLLGLEPKDFDIATNARPEEIKKLFKNALLIGKRFRLVHVRFRQEIIEVATFRRASFGGGAEGNDHPEGLLRRDNVYGDMEDDVWRRDFTMNALYYDPKTFSVIDYTGGVSDIQSGIVRIIGSPEERFREDPVRLLRAVRLACKLGFTIEEKTLAPFTTLAHLLRYVAPARLFDEVLKLFLSGFSATTFAELRRFRLFEQLFPETEAILLDPKQNHITDLFLLTLLKHTDERVQQGKTVNPAYLFAGFLWMPLLKLVYQHKAAGLRTAPAFELAMKDIVSLQQKTIMISRRYVAVMQDIWRMQSQFEKRYGNRPYKLLQHPKFRAGYDFLLLRAESDPELQSLAHWWTAFYHGDEEKRTELMQKFKFKRKR